MNKLQSTTGSIKKLPAVTRKSLSASQEQWVKTDYLSPSRPLPLVIQPAIDGLNLADWARNNREFVETHLLTHGGLLFRNFKVNEVGEFESFLRASAGEPLEYHERSSPRTQVSGNIYSSTDHPADQSIFLHNEQSYNRTFPLRILFFCMTPATQGGETPIADTRRVFKRIDPGIRQCFLQKQWMYVRNFGDGFGLQWQEAFQTEDRTQVEVYCRSVGIEFEWKDGGRLRTRQVRPAAAPHPQTGEAVWFNHATFFHVSTLEKTTQESLLTMFQAEDLPNNTYYGDGSTIEPSVMDELREAYWSETVSFRWEKGDVLMLDNMLVAHGRAPFIGPRKVVVGMAQPFTRSDI